MKNQIPNGGDALGNRHTGQAASVPEGLVTNAGDAVSYRHSRQINAVKEGPISNADYALWYRYVSQAATVPEGLFPNAGDRLAFVGGWNNQVAFHKTFLSGFVSTDGNSFGMYFEFQYRRV